MLTSAPVAAASAVGKSIVPHGFQQRSLALHHMDIRLGAARQEQFNDGRILLSVADCEG